MKFFSVLLVPNYDGRESLRLTPEKRFWPPMLVLFPVLQAELDINTPLTQNPGW